MEFYKSFYNSERIYNSYSGNISVCKLVKVYTEALIIVTTIYIFGNFYDEIFRADT